MRRACVQFPLLSTHLPFPEPKYICTERRVPRDYGDGTVPKHYFILITEDLKHSGSGARPTDRYCGCAELSVRFSLIQLKRHARVCRRRDRWLKISALFRYMRYKAPVVLLPLPLQLKCSNGPVIVTTDTKIFYVFLYIKRFCH